MNNILMLFIFVPILSGILLLLNFFLAPKNAYESKVSAYECGFSPIYGQTRNVFHINFFLVALLFLVFDLEVLLLYPLAVTLYQVSVFGFSVAILFFIVLTIGFILEIGSGSISISNKEIKNISSPLSNIKLKVNVFLKAYLKIVNLHTGYKFTNKFILLLMFIISILSFFFKEDILLKFSDNLLILNTLALGSICNIIYLKFNTACRFTYTFIKGIPYFYKEINNKNTSYSYLIGFLIYNIMLILFSIIYIIKIYSTLSLWFGSSIIFFIYNTYISICIFILYLEEDFTKRTFSLDENRELNIIQKIFIFSLSSLLLLNLSQYLPSVKDVFIFLKNSNTIYCQPLEVSDTKNNTNLQNNNQVQLSSHINNENTQTNKIPVFSRTVQIISIEELQKIHRSLITINTKFLTCSFWDNIHYLHRLMSEGYFNIDYLYCMMNLVVKKALNTSAVNTVVYHYFDGRETSWSVFRGIHLPGGVNYYKYFGFPVLFNNYYEFMSYNPTDKYLHSHLLFKNGDSSSIVEFMKAVNKSNLSSDDKKFILGKTLLILGEIFGITFNPELHPHKLEDLFKSQFSTLIREIHNNKYPMEIFSYYNFKVLCLDFIHQPFRDIQIKVFTFVIFDSLDQLLIYKNFIDKKLLDSWINFTNSSQGCKLISNENNLSLSNNKSFGIINTLAFNNQNFRQLHNKINDYSLNSNNHLFSSNELNIIKNSFSEVSKYKFIINFLYKAIKQLT